VKSIATRYVVGKAQRGGEGGQVVSEGSAAKTGGTLEVIAHGALRDAQPASRFRCTATAFDPLDDSLAHPRGSATATGEVAECVGDELVGGGWSTPDKGLHGDVFVTRRRRGPHAQRHLKCEKRLLVAGDEAADTDRRLTDADPAAEAVEGFDSQAPAIAPRPPCLRCRGGDKHRTDVFRAQNCPEPLGGRAACHYCDVRTARTQSEAGFVE
jgi:hypothetical protein